MKVANIFLRPEFELGKLIAPGQVYLRTLLHLITRNSEKLSEVQKDFFKQKQGSLVTQPNNQLKQKFVVGDIVLETFVKNSWTYSLGILIKDQIDKYMCLNFCNICRKLIR